MFAVSTPHGEGIAQLAFFGLFALQHRGQEAAGIAVSDGSRVRMHKESGLVSNVFTPATMSQLTGYHAIGHTRYSTTGANAQRNIQPFLVETMHGPLAVAHNGNLVNAPALRTELLTKGFGLTASSDTEVMTLMLTSAGGRDWEERLERTLPAWKGAYSLVVLTHDRVLAARDPWGFRPLSVGRLPDGGWAAASETCALLTLGCTDVSEVRPGEIVTLQGADIRRRAMLVILTELTEQKYKYGFVTDVAEDRIRKGLDEDVVRLISSKKNEPAFLLDFRLKAFRHWLTLEEPTWAKVAILITNLWLGFPYMFLICTGALQSVPGDVKEAAKIDGASGFRTIRSIVMPLVLVAVGPLLVASYAFNFNNFALIYLLTNGGPFEGNQTQVGSTDLLITYAFRLAIGGTTPNFGFAAAISMFIFIIVALISLQGFRSTASLEDVN